MEELNFEKLKDEQNYHSEDSHLQMRSLLIKEVTNHFNRTNIIKNKLEKITDPDILERLKVEFEERDKKIDELLDLKNASREGYSSQSLN